MRALSSYVHSFYNTLRLSLTTMPANLDSLLTISSTLSILARILTSRGPSPSTYVRRSSSSRAVTRLGIVLSE